MHTSIRKLTSNLIASALLLGAGARLPAQAARPETAPDDAHKLDPVVVTAEREPGNFLLGQDEIARTNAVDLAQLFANQSTLAVGGGAPQAQKIYVRGFEDVLLNVTLDGAPQAGELYHHQGRLQLEPEFIKRIQLDAGAGAATAGAGALTGVLAITTKDAFDLLESGRRFGLSTRATYSANGDDAWQGVASLYGKLTEQVGLIVGYARQSGDDYEDGHGNLVAPTAFEHTRGYAKLNGRFGDHEASLAYERVHDTGTYYERPNFVNFTGTYILSDHDLNRETLTYNHRFNPAGDLVDTRATLFWTASDFLNRRNTTQALYGKGDFSSVGLDLRNTSAWDRHAATYGVEYRVDDAFGRQQATPPPFWGSSRQSVKVLGLYAQDNWQVADTVKLSAGLRFDDYQHAVDAGVGTGASNDDQGFSPNASLEWEALPGLTLRTAYAQSFRGITIREAFFSGLYIHQGGLEPEQADNLEFGLAYEKNGFFARATLYRQTIENYINAVFVGTPVWGYWRNVGDAKVDGYEAEFGRRWHSASLSLGVWEADNTFNGRPLNDGDLGLGTRIGRTWLARADWFPTRDLELGLRGRHVESEANSISATAPAKPAYTTADLHAHWRPLGDRRLTLSLSVNNAFDEFYYDHATYSYHAGTGKYIGFPAKGREFVLSAAYKF
jgi:hemoglobin/transferrin/lactoferrin receptor protein